jgi:hypothetical protein
MIIRIWHGWTSFSNAKTYETLLKSEIFIGIKSRKIKGFNGIELLSRKLDSEIEFVTIMNFDSLDAIKEFAGPDYETAVVPQKARELLNRFDEKSQHYEVLHKLLS